MITVIYSTHKDQEYNKKFKENLEKYISIKDYEILEYQNNNEFSLAEIYNKGISEAKYDIVVCCHNDIKLGNDWGKKLLKIFNENPDYGIIGKAGSWFFPKSGIYWERIKETMVGQVYHQPDDKVKWLNEYSPKSPSLVPVVTVDGLFIAFDKRKIKHKFDESLGGFHFYDHGFCVPNFLDGVKIGVTSSFVITHQSVGETNEEFFKTKNKFIEKYGNILPLVVKPKMKVLIGCLFFFSRTGSEMYVFELAKNLMKMDCDVTVVSPNINGVLAVEARNIGIKVNTFESLPKDVVFDIIHTQHQPITLELIRRFPTTKKIATIHSEVLDAEYPIIHPSIVEYIAIRPNIVEMLVNKFKIPREKISLIYNPIDNEKFHPLDVDGENAILFVGTVDYLRRAALFDMVEHTKEREMNLWIIGKNHSDYLQQLLESSHVKYFEPTPDVEQYIHRCKETAGILLGRTTIEGWMCGKPGWIYEIDHGGNILSKNFFDVPTDVEKFHSTTVAKQIKERYEKILS